VRVQLWSGAPYEYSRSANGLVFTAGASPLDDEGDVIAPGDVAIQAERAVENLLTALIEAGVSRGSLLKTTVYVVAESHEDLVEAWAIVREHLGSTPSTLLGVTALGYPGQVVEIEAVAALEA
jgi:enamine deaminase RidA (YjgF/YER057c/UK114 family)